MSVCVCVLGASSVYALHQITKAPSAEGGHSPPQARNFLGCVCLYKQKVLLFGLSWPLITPETGAVSYDGKRSANKGEHLGVGSI